MARRNGVGIALLADSTRRAIIALIAVQPRRPAFIAAELGLSRPAVSRQLRLLEDAGLVRAFPFQLDRRGLLYQIDPGALRHITAWLAGTDVGRARPP